MREPEQYDPWFEDQHAMQIGSAHSVSSEPAEEQGGEFVLYHGVVLVPTTFKPRPRKIGFY